MGYLWILVCLAAAPRAAAAYAIEHPVNPQVVNPAEKAKDNEKEKGAPAPDQSAENKSAQHHTWEMPPVEVFGKAPLAEEDRIGDYSQPRWTAHRRFGETRVYVIPKGMVEFEYWMRPKIRKNGPSEFTNMYEAEFGLPGRLQLDLYAVAHKEGSEGSYGFDENKVEVRYAFADWGKIPGNPTAYIEWGQESNGPDVLELKLLLGGQITTGWHWGSNLVWEHQTAGEEENSNEWTTGVSYTVRDSKLGIGLETQLAFVNSLESPGRRGPFQKEFLVGPSLQWRPLPQMHLDVAPLFGTTRDSPRSKVYVVLGYEF